MHKGNVYHGHLINDNHICIQGILLVPVKMHSRASRSGSAGLCGAGNGGSVLGSRGNQLKHPVDGPGLVSCGFGHPLGSPAGGSAQENFQPFFLKIADNGIDCGCLARTGSPGDNQKAASRSLENRLLLKRIQGNSLFFLQPGKGGAYFLLRRAAADIQIMKHPGGI